MSGSSSSSTTRSSSSAGPSRSSSASPAHFLPTPALDHAFAGITAGVVATVCMNPLDLIKVKFQVDTARPGSGLVGAAGQSKVKTLGYYLSGGKVVRDVGDALRDIVRQDGWRGLYRGLSPNVVGNSASWGLYFLWYTMIKEYMASDGSDGKGKAKQLSPTQHLLAASESGAITALMTNPVWVVKTRMFATRASASVGAGSVSAALAAAATSRAALGATSNATATPPPPPAQPPIAYRGLWHGLTHIWSTEGIRGLYRGAGLALVGVSNGAIQFVAYEELKKWRSGLARRRGAGLGGDGAEGDDHGGAVKLSNVEYIIMSGFAKLVAIGLTYPYQVVRSRIQNHTTSHLYPDIPTCIRLTYQHEGIRGFYKGMATSAIRILPGTCVTFVVYENTSWALKEAAERRDRKKEVLAQDTRETTSSDA